MSLANKLRFAASPAEVLVVARAVTLLIAIPALLKLAGIEKIARILTPSRTRTKKAIPDDRIRVLCHRTFGFARRMAYHPNCLRRSLILYHCLRSNGNPAVLHFGVKRGGDALAGHCWLTLDGSLYDDRPEMVSQFAHMFSLPTVGTRGAERLPPEGPPPDVRCLSFDR